MGMHRGEPNSGFGVRKSLYQRENISAESRKTSKNHKGRERGRKNDLSRGGSESKSLKLGERELRGHKKFRVAGARPEVA